MSNQNQNQPIGQSDDERPRKRRRGRLGYLFAALIGAVVGVVGVGVGAKYAFHAGWRDQAGFERFVDHGLDRMLNRIEVDGEQRTEVKRILLGASREMRDLALEMRDSRGALVAALTGAAVDRERIETLRAERVASLDQGSQRALQALADAAEVLTPEQRAGLAERFERRHY